MFVFSSIGNGKLIRLFATLVAIAIYWWTGSAGAESKNTGSDGLSCNWALRTDNGGRVAGKVNGKPVTEAQYELYAQQLIREKQIPRGDGNEIYLFDSLIDEEILAQQAIDKGLDKRADVMNELQMQWRKTLAQAYMRYYRHENPLTEAQVKRVYVEQKDILWPKQYKVREIVVEKEFQAREVIGKLGSSESFSALARRYSVAESRNAGGLVGWVKVQQLPVQARELVEELEIGAWLQNPVFSDDRWYVYQLEKVRTPMALPFKEVATGIQSYSEKRAIAIHLTKLRAHSNIEILLENSSQRTGNHSN
ncbi:MAG: peptidylprolyl isomerase [Pseudomonadota bacterium]